MPPPASGSGAVDRQVVGGEKDRLGAVLDHGIDAVQQGGNRIRHILGHDRDADHVDGFELLADAAEQLDVGDRGWARFAGLGIDPKDGVMPGGDPEVAIP